MERFNYFYVIALSSALAAFSGCDSSDQAQPPLPANEAERVLFACPKPASLTDVAGLEKVERWRLVDSTNTTFRLQQIHYYVSEKDTDGSSGGAAEVVWQV